MRFTTDTTEIKWAFEALQSKLSQLIDALCAADVQACRAFPYPRVQKDSETALYKFIPVNTIEGEDAFDQACMAYLNFFGNGSESTRAVYRLPGVLHVKTGQPQALTKLIGEVNELKDHFQRCTAALPDSLRFEIVHKAYPQLIQLQVTRHINHIEGDVQAVNFTWGASSSIVRVDSDEVLLELREMKERTSSIDRLRDIVADEERVKNAPEGFEFRGRRVLKVRPLININFGKDAPRRYQRKEGHLPLIVINSESFKIGTLADYSFLRQRKERSDRMIGEEAYFSTLPIYLKSQNKGRCVMLK